MKTNWLILIALIVSLGMLAGCEQPKPDTSEAKAAAQGAKEAAMAAGDLAVNPDILPPPRPAMETAPDLSNGKLVVNDTTLQRMSDDGVPSDVIAALSGMQGQEFTNAAEFAAAVRTAAGAGADAHMDAIMRNALVISLADAAQPPQGELSLAERQEAKMEAVGAFKVVYFDFDKSDIKPEFMESILENADRLKADSSMKVTIEGHCDERGTNEYNLALGQRRAEAVRKALIAEGVDAAQLKTISYGEERPADSGHDEEAWAKNRRGEIIVN
jgi:peptidoglycan-associated lipoprotein